MSGDLVAAVPDWLAGLNAEQRAAATHGCARVDGRVEAGPLLVIAGAGTGKTATLAHRVAWLSVQGVPPDRLLLMSFSRRAAVQVAERAGVLAAQALAAAARPTRSTQDGPVLTRAGARLQLPWAGTFHSVAARLLREHAGDLGLPADFGIIDRGDSADLLDEQRERLGFARTHRRFPRKDTCLAIYSRSVNAGEALATVLARHWPWCEAWQRELGELFSAYVAAKQAQNLLDYDDLLLWWELALEQPAVAQRMRARFDHILVDEYQDTNAVQARILRRLSPEGGGLTVVGDDAQSIYAFRAAEVGNILGFADSFRPPADRITLETSYRSTQPVLDLANAVLREAAHQYPKTLRAAAGTPADAARPQLVTVLDDQAQADAVIDAVLERREAGVALREQAVLFRSAHHSDVLELALVRRNVPYVKYGGLKFLEAAHIKDVLALLRWVDNPRNRLAALRSLQLVDGLGPVLARRCLDQWDQQDFSALTLGGRAVDIAGVAGGLRGLKDLLAPLHAARGHWSGQFEAVRAWYEPVLERRYADAHVRAPDLAVMQTLAERYGTRERFLTELTLDPPSASSDWSGDPLRDEDYLILSTVHSAKGQEWDSVYVLNVSDGNFPNEFATGDPASLEEERRLFYVALTRARRRLRLLEPQRYYVTQQARHGPVHVYGARSRFLTSAVLDCLEQTSGGIPEQESMRAAATVTSLEDRTREADRTLADSPLARRLPRPW